MTKTTINTPSLNSPEKYCPSCGRDCHTAWGWLYTATPSGLRRYDLCGGCARTMRYASEAEQQAIVDCLLARVLAQAAYGQDDSKTLDAARLRAREEVSA